LSELVPNGVWQHHQTLNQVVLNLGVLLSADKKPDRLIENVDLGRLQIADDTVQVVEDLVNEGDQFALLNLNGTNVIPSSSILCIHVPPISKRQSTYDNKLSPAFVRNFDESVTGHILHALMCF